jgi:hypothetical protein
VKYLKCFEDFKVNNIQEEDIIKCIDSDGYIETDIVVDLPDNPDEPIRPVSIDREDITVEINNKNYNVKLGKVKKVIFSDEN